MMDDPGRDRLKCSVAAAPAPVVKAVAEIVPVLVISHDCRDLALRSFRRVVKTESVHIFEKHSELFFDEKLVLFNIGSVFGRKVNFF